MPTIPRGEFFYAESWLLRQGPIRYRASRGINSRTFERVSDRRWRLLQKILEGWPVPTIQGWFLQTALARKEMSPQRALPSPQRPSPVGLGEPPRKPLAEED